MMKVLIVPAFLLAVVSSAFAYPVNLSSPAGVVKLASGVFMTNSGSVVVSSSYAAKYSYDLGGKKAFFNAAFKLGAGASRAAVIAMRANPGRLVLGALAAWALEAGIRNMNGSLVVGSSDPDSCSANCKKIEFPSRFPYDKFVAKGGTPAAACKALLDYNKSSSRIGNLFAPATVSTYSVTGGGVSAQYRCETRATDGQLVDFADGILVDAPPTASPDVPATDSDFAKLEALPLPDAAANQLIVEGIPLPLDSPLMSPDPQEIPLSDPYVDPVTKKRYQDKAIITPSKTNPGTADIQVAKREVDESGQPVKNDDGTDKPLQENKDECLEHPDRVACMDKGTKPEDPELPEDQRDFSIKPDTGWGPDNASCPADISFAVMGKPLKISYDPICRVADMIRPLVIAVAWIGALLIAFGMMRRSSNG